MYLSDFWKSGLIKRLSDSSIKIEEENSQVLRYYMYTTKHKIWPNIFHPKREFIYMFFK